MWWGLAWVALVATIATSTTVVADHSDSPDEVLARIERFVRTHPSYRYTVRSAFLGAAIGDLTIDGEVTGTRRHEITSGGRIHFESITTEDTTYSRTARSGGP